VAKNTLKSTSKYVEMCLHKTQVENHVERGKRETSEENCSVKRREKDKIIIIIQKRTVSNVNDFL